KPISKPEEKELKLHLGYLNWNMGLPKDALLDFEKAKELSKAIHDNDSYSLNESLIKIISLYSTAKEQRSADLYSESISTFQEAIRISRSINHPEFELKCLRQMSAVYLEQNELAQFLKLNEISLKMAKELNFFKDEGYCLNNIGLYYYKVDEYSKALIFFENSLEIIRKTGNTEAENECLNNIGAVYKDIGEYEKSLSYFFSSLALDKKASNPEFIIISLNNIGTVYRKKGLISKSRSDFNQALRYLEEGHRFAKDSGQEKLEIRVANNIGTIYSDLLDYQKALHFYTIGLTLAEKLKDKEVICFIINNIGIVYSQMGKYEESTRYFQKAIDIAVEVNAGQVLWEAFLEMGNAFKKRNLYSDALKSYQYSIEVIEKTRSSIEMEDMKASFLGTDRRLEAYHNAIDLLFSMNQPNPSSVYTDQAFRYFEKAKARSFLDSLEISRISIVQEIDLQQANQEKQINNDLTRLYKKLLSAELSLEQKASINENIKTVEDDYAKLKRDIRARNPVYAGLRFPDILGLDDIQKRSLDNQTIAFTYSVGKEASYGFAVTRSGSKFFPLPSRDILADKISRFLKTLTDKENHDFSLGVELFGILIAPGLDRDYPHILIIPDDVLHYLPFETLRSTSKGKWIAADSDVSYAPSLSSLQEITERARGRASKRQKDLLAFGDPDYGDSSIKAAFFEDQTLSRLPFSEKEVAKIAQLFNPQAITVLRRQEATELAVKNVKPDDFRIIHFAAHGLIDDQKPARSSIVLSIDPHSPEDGFLQAREIFDLRLNADLIVLSSCRTAGGRLIRGEGIEGLNRSFFYAGASAVLMSLWPVNDEATSLLMERFYLHLKAEDSIAGALQKAKMDLIGSPDFSHPY
ncbi:MAG: CHAT domain-containing protein, partial [Desulfobacteraceae bacterium]